MRYHIELFLHQPKEVLAVQNLIIKEGLPEPSLEYLKTYGDIISTGKKDEMSFELINDNLLHCDVLKGEKWETVMVIRTTNN